MNHFFRAITMFVVLSMSIAQASSTGSLRALVQDYQYQTTVEWDQKDPQFLEAARDNLILGLEALRAKGLSERELLIELEGRFNNPQSAADLEVVKTDLEQGSIDQDVFIERVLDIVNKDQKTGASWSGRGLVVGVALTLAIVWIAWTIDVCDREGCDPSES